MGALIPVKTASRRGRVATCSCGESLARVRACAGMTDFTLLSFILTFVFFVPFVVSVLINSPPARPH